MQERYDEAFRSTGAYTMARPPSNPVLDTVMKDKDLGTQKKAAKGPKPVQPIEFDGDRAKG
jgi:hypothetical protein